MKSKNFVWGFLTGMLIVVILSLSGFIYGLYKYNWTSPLTSKIVSIIPYKLPAMKVNGKVFSYKDYLADLMDVQAYFAKNPQQGEINQQVVQGIFLNALNNLILEDLARKYNITVSEEDYNKVLKDIVKGDLTDENLKPFKEWLNDNYGWDLDKYKVKVLKYMILGDKLSQKLVEDDSYQKNKDAKTKIEKAKAELDGGKDFAEVAKEYSEDPSAEQGGDLGWFPLSAMVPEFSDKLKDMKKGEVSDVFPSRFGYHIVKLIDIRDNTDTGEKEYHAAHIITLGENLNQILTDKIKEADIKIYIKGITKEDLLKMLNIPIAKK